MSLIHPRVRASAGLFCVEALRALFRHKLRSALTTLGISIGIASVVCVVAIGKAGSARAEAELQNLGNNLVWVEAGSRNVNGVRTGNVGMTNLTIEDAEAILREIPTIRTMSPQVDGNVFVVRGQRSWTTRYRGVGPDYVDIKRWKIAEGSPLTESQVSEAASVALIGRTAKEQLFGADDPLGQDVRIGSQLFQIIGVLAPKGQTPTGYDQDDAIMLPYTTAQLKLRGRGVGWLDDILCSAVSPQAVNPAIDQIIELMRQRHHIQPGEADDFNIRRPDELIKAQIEASRTLALLLLSMASIALLVGGIGIMNVMLVSVTERTREIGIRLAVGATEGAVQAQFLGEAVMLSLIGGVLGVGLGVLSSFALGELMEWPMAIPAEAIPVALGFSIAVGVFFGFYPARKAARLDPIAALRYE